MIPVFGLTTGSGRELEVLGEMRVEWISWLAKGTLIGFEAWKTRSVHRSVSLRRAGRNQTVPLTTEGVSATYPVLSIQEALTWLGVRRFPRRAKSSRSLNFVLQEMIGERDSSGDTDAILVSISQFKLSNSQQGILTLLSRANL